MSQPQEQSSRFASKKAVTLTLIGLLTAGVFIGAGITYAVSSQAVISQTVNVAKPNTIQIHLTNSSLHQNDAQIFFDRNEIVLNITNITPTTLKDIVTVQIFNATGLGVTDHYSFSFSPGTSVYGLAPTVDLVTYPWTDIYVSV